MQGQRSDGIGSSPIKNIPPRRKRISHVERETQPGSAGRRVTTRASFGVQRSTAAPSKSSHNSQPRPFTVRPAGPAPVIRPSTLTNITFPPPPSTRTKADFFLNWLQNNKKSFSADERIFVLAARSYGIEKAVMMADGTFHIAHCHTLHTLHTTPRRTFGQSIPQVRTAASS